MHIAKIITVLSLVLATPAAWATSIFEPGMVPLLAMGAVVGIFLHWRSKRKK